VPVSMSRRQSSLAGFQVIMSGRFWVITEAGGGVKPSAGVSLLLVLSDGVWRPAQASRDASVTFSPVESLGTGVTSGNSSPA
jgi:hypothetical protein